MEDDVRYKTDYLEGETHRAFATSLGHAMRLLASCTRRDLPIKAAIRGLWPAIQLGQILFLYNSKGLPVAYATWMHVTGDVASSLRDCPEDTLDVSERNEGDQLWITDIVAPFGDIRALVKKMRQCVPLNGGIVRGSRWNRAGTGRRVIEISLRFSK
jgi:hemolysin-activating ACP:hemolysin acyltransferase